MAFTARLKRNRKVKNSIWLTIDKYAYEITASKYRDFGFSIYCTHDDFCVATLTVTFPDTPKIMFIVPIILSDLPIILSGFLKALEHVGYKDQATTPGDAQGMHDERGDGLEQVQ